jgi:hypothetical protein
MFNAADHLVSLSKSLDPDCPSLYSHSTLARVTQEAAILRRKRGMGE